MEAGGRRVQCVCVCVRVRVRVCAPCACACVCASGAAACVHACAPRPTSPSAVFFCGPPFRVSVRTSYPFAWHQALNPLEWNRFFTPFSVRPGNMAESLFHWLPILV